MDGVVHKFPFVSSCLQFEQEYRRFHMNKGEMTTFDAFYTFIRTLHKLLDIDGVTISYTDPMRGDLLPINNDDNFAHAVSLSKPLLRIFVYRGQGEQTVVGVHGATVVFLFILCARLTVRV